jgi:hypothetical protein
MNARRPDRFLLFILIGIAVLVLLALGLYFTRQSAPTYVPEDTPAGVAQNFATALSLKDYERAFGYVAGPPGVQVSEPSKGQAGLPDLAHFREFYLTEVRDQFTNTGLQVEDGQVQSADSAFVNVTILRTSGSLFNSVSRQSEQVRLVRQNGAWKITQAPYPFWNYAWAVVPAAPAK